MKTVFFNFTECSQKHEKSPNEFIEIDKFLLALMIGMARKTTHEKNIAPYNLLANYFKSMY